MATLVIVVTWILLIACWLSLVFFAIPLAFPEIVQRLSPEEGRSES